MLLIALTNPSNRISGFCRGISMEVGVNVFCSPRANVKVFEKVVAVIEEYARAIPADEKFSATMMKITGMDISDIRTIGLPRRQFTDIDGTLLLVEYVDKLKLAI